MHLWCLFSFFFLPIFSEFTTRNEQETKSFSSCNQTWSRREASGPIALGTRGAGLGPRGLAGSGLCPGRSGRRAVGHRPLVQAGTLPRKEAEEGAQGGGGPRDLPFTGPSASSALRSGPAPFPSYGRPGASPWASASPRVEWAAEAPEDPSARARGFSVSGSF